MHVCVIYDCLFPHTVGGAERWYANLAERLARDGHQVTYLTLRQSERGERPHRDAPVRRVAAGPRMSLDPGARRTVHHHHVSQGGTSWNFGRPFYSG